MKEVTLATLVSVFQEMMGIWFWVLVAVALVGAIAVVAVVVKDGKIGAARAIRSELAAPFGGIFGVWLALAVTQSKFADMGGPIDWLLIAIIFVVGAGGATVIAYVAQGLLASKERSPAAGE